MRSALYYPHTEMKRDSLLKSAMLLWDQVEFIVPFEDYKPYYSNEDVREAIELIGVMHYPSKAERRQAHEEIEALVSAPLPASFFLQSRDPSDQYQIYPQKLMPDTWELLKDARLAGEQLSNADYPLAQHAGLSVMAVLADCCAGETKRRITDRGAAYASLVGRLGSLALGRSRQDVANDEERVVAVTLKVLDAGAIPLRKLTAFRKLELKESGHSIRLARHRYTDHLEAHVKRLRTISRQGDRKELDRVFEQEVRDDLAALREGLKINLKDAIFSKEMLTTFVVGAGAVAAAAFGAPVRMNDAVTAVGAPVAIGGVLGVRNRFLKARRELLGKHPMAYLYEAKGGLRL
jgi:hypothetical protein